MTSGYNIEETLHMAKLTALWLQHVGQVMSTTTTGDTDLDDEIGKSIAIAQASLLHWRLAVGERAGLLQIKPLEEYVEDR